MKRKIQLFRARMRGGARVLAILLIAGTCLALPVWAESGDGDWGIMAARSKEYASSDVPKEIPGSGTVTSTLTIADAGPIADLNVKLNITHTQNMDLDVFLIAPDGTRVELFTDVGGMSANFTDTILDDEAPKSIYDGSGPFAGSYRPVGKLADFIGKDIAGTWTLEVTDDWDWSQAGTLNAWSLIATLEIKELLPPPVIHVESSVPGGILDTIRWDDIGQARQYDSAVAQAIPDKGTVTPALVIDDFGLIEDLNIKLNITHGLDSDLDVFLVAPDGKTRVELFTDVGGTGDNFTDTVLDDEASRLITAGSAPFTGTYRPEGKLSDLVGKDIHGPWTLEVTDDSLLSSGTLNSWSLVVNVADVVYCAQCATDAAFKNIVGESGWIIDRSYTFTGLEPNSPHWFRAKARPLETWFQTSQADFQTDTLTSTQATGEGDVILAGGGGADGLGSELHVIADPSFESLAAWSGDRTNSNIFVGSVSGLWASDGPRAGAVLFSSDSFYMAEDLGLLLQPVDWTGVDKLVFDYASFGFANLLVAGVFIGDTLVWVKSGTDASMYPPRFTDAHYNEPIDVSAYDGVRDLALVVQTAVSGRFDAGILWDNLRTYGPSAYAASGTVVSTPIRPNEGDTWDILGFNATIPTGAALTVDVLPASGSVPVPGYVNLLSGADLSGLAEANIRLRANLSTSNTTVTPTLHDWKVSYTDAARESPWSNVESSVAAP